jgi:hypothetical protein
MKRRLQALAVLLLFGVVKLPMDAAFSRHLLEARLLNPPVDMALRDNLGQMSFAATLGGLRSLVASITRMQAYVEWENVNWGKVDELFSITVRLQPRYENYWDEASWHMAFNAGTYYLLNQQLNPILRQRLHEQHVARGLEIIHEGLRVLPESAKLWLRLAEIEERKRFNPAKAGEAYLKAYENSGFRIYWRMAGYQFAQSKEPELWRKGYEMLMDSYQKNEKKPSVINHLKNLEQRLNVPPERRIPDAAPPLAPRS